MFMLCPPRASHAPLEAAMTDLTLYTHPMSRGRIARWMLEEVGEPYEVELLDYGTSMKSPAYLAVNPMGKVPALRHGSVVVTECAAVCAYLAEAFPKADLTPPPGAPERAAFLRWMFFAAGPVEAATTVTAMGFQVPPERAGMAGWGGIEAVADALGGALAGGPYLLGERFSAADVYVGSQLGWGRQFGTLPDRPAFAAYLERVMARPAALRAKALDDALLAPQG
jgi:glutathione S-transferase